MQKVIRLGHLKSRDGCSNFEEGFSLLIHEGVPYSMYQLEKIRIPGDPNYSQWYKDKQPRFWEKRTRQGDTDFNFIFHAEILGKASLCILEVPI
ncbi:hypothetical protein YDYSY3_38860 [Paenibacillus chitinolyticus]|uniref:hypothetical protein n=1 Tax=Paenibacillus chitinolyticus TaxID=79263 RepID=UPI0026E4AC22|nr:hypothetical protein [Paenibacillus chitinolyticus]GKS12886.1 hypothetical protein YDYSY3_38860 [Paenibacillus chitinolyticus]